jgi:hypothetical protein
MRALVLCMLCSCIGYGEFISPMDAYKIEHKQCMQRASAEDQRICLSMLEKKYRQYFGEGGYPREFVPPNPRQ